MTLGEIIVSPARRRIPSEPGSYASSAWTLEDIFFSAIYHLNDCPHNECQKQTLGALREFERGLIAAIKSGALVLDGVGPC